MAGSPAPEVQFLRNALMRDKSLEFASWLQSAEPGYEHPGSRPILRLPATQQELDHYDVLLLFDPDLQHLPPEWPEMVTKFVGSAAGGLIYVAGELHTQDLFNDAAADARTSGTSGNAWTKLLPVVREPGMYQSTAEVQLSRRESWVLELTPQGIEDPVFHFAAHAPHNREVLASLPGMYWHFPVTRAKPGASVLARHGDPRTANNFGRHVLLATQFYGPGARYSSALTAPIAGGISTKAISTAFRRNSSIASAATKCSAAAFLSRYRRTRQCIKLATQLPCEPNSSTRGM